MWLLSLLCIAGEASCTIIMYICQYPGWMNTAVTAIAEYESDTEQHHYWYYMRLYHWAARNNITILIETGFNTILKTSWK